MRKSLTTTSYALLGLLALKPWSTYELAKQVQRSLNWFWPRTERKLYDEPRQLVAHGFAVATEQHTGKRPRTLYSITPEGRRALRRWLSDPPAPSSLEMEAMVKVFFADGGSLSQLRETLERVREQATERLAALRSMIEVAREGTAEFEERLALNALGLRYELDHHQLQAEWATWALDQIEAWRSPTDARGWDWYDAVSGGRVGLRAAR
jgi:DNA-binding PadR family transcriptional regulator